jgi:hypothetical protein
MLRLVPPGSTTLYFYEVSIFFDLFNPNNRHRTEELRRLENTREDEAQGEPGRGPIDLNSGMVLIRVPNKESATSEDEADAVEGDAAEADSAEDGAIEGDVIEDAHAHAGSENSDAAAPTEENGGA